MKAFGKFVLSVVVFYLVAAVIVVGMFSWALAEMAKVWS